MRRLLLVLGLVIMFAVPGAVMHLLKDSDRIILTADNIVNIRSVIDEDSVQRAISDIEALRAKNAGCKIYLVMDSPGGSIEAGWKLIKYLLDHRNIDTITIRAYSMASAIVEANPGKRYVVRNGDFIFHRGIGIPNAKYLQALEEVNASRIGISLDEYRNRVTLDWRIKGYDAVRENVADRQVDLVCDPSLDELSDSYPRIINFFGKLVNAGNIELAKCPLVTNPFFIHQ